MLSRITFVVCIFALLVAACQIGPSASSTPTVADREQIWLNQHITAYRIEVMVVRSIWHAQSHQLVVRDNQVESATATCIPAPFEAGECQVEDFTADDYTVPG